MIRLNNAAAKSLLLTSLLLLAGICQPVNATNLTGTFKHPDGSPVNGKLIFLLSQPARLSNQSAQIVPMVKIFSITNGLLEAGAFVYGNDVLLPTGTYYLVRLVDSSNNLLFEQKWAITGVNLDLGTLTPTTTGVVVPDPLLKNVSSDQAVQGPVSFSAPVTAFSLTLNGNLNPGSPDSYNLGSPTAPWLELFAQRWSSLVTVGSSGGFASAPSIAPSASVQSSGGSIGAGTYYFKVTYFNRNGETTASPTRTVTVSSGTTNRIHIGPGDFNWTTGCYGYLVYASNDNVNFYAQTPSGVVGDFELTSANGGAPTGKVGHYVALGSLGARFNSLTFSGATPPVTNTATIDPMQVTLNATFGATGVGTPVGTLVVPAAQNGYLLTTPLIVPKYARIIGSSAYGVAKDDAGQSRILGNWADTKTAVVMTFGGKSSIENVEVRNYSGHGVMYLGGVGYSSEGNIAINSGFSTADTTNTYAALKIVGIHYNIHHHNVYLRGGRAAIQAVNAAGSHWTFGYARHDLGGSSHFQNVTGWTDPDNGVNDGAWQNASSKIAFIKLLVEQGTGILVDGVNAGFLFDRVEYADVLTAGGTDSLFKAGNDAFGAGSEWVIRDAYLPTATAARVGLNVVSNTSQGVSLFIFNGSTGAGQSTGTLQALDMNNKTMYVFLSHATVNFNPAATSYTVLNVPNSSSGWAVQGTGNPAQAGAGKIWNEFMDRIVLWSSNSNRTVRKSWFMNGSVLELRQSDDTTVDMDVNPTSGFFNFRGNARFMAYAGAAGQVCIGPSASTAVGGTICVVNSGSMFMRNAAGSADVRLIAGDSADRAIVGDANGVCLSTTTNCSPIKGNLSATATLDFGNTAASTCSDLTIGLNGAAVGDVVLLGVPVDSVLAGGVFSAWVSANNTVTVRFCADGTARDPASGSFRASVLKF